jgi:outer membrane murein-binding lipoprotein Lpp
MTRRVPGPTAGSPVVPRHAGHAPFARPRPTLTLTVTAVLIALGSSLLAGCAGQEQSGTPSVRVTTWVKGASGGVAIGTVEVDARNVDLAVARHNTAAALRTVCALLTTDAQTAIGNLPTPDDRLTNDLNIAYEEASAAGDDCYEGSDGNAALMRRSAEERKKLVPLLATAVDRIVAVTGRTPSTSTTAPSGAGDDPFGN